MDTLISITLCINKLIHVKMCMFVCLCVCVFYSVCYWADSFDSNKNKDFNYKSRLKSTTRSRNFSLNLLHFEML